MNYFIVVYTDKKVTGGNQLERVFGNFAIGLERGWSFTQARKVLMNNGHENCILLNHFELTKDEFDEFNREVGAA